MIDQNRDLALAWEFVEHTGQSIFLTGNAGTGKTTFLKTVTERSSKRMVVVAPTGVAAINAGGVTIHSFFQLPLTPFIPNAQMQNRHQFSVEKRKIMRTLDLLVIDEISMVRSDLLDAIDFVLRQYRQPDRPFGGVQLLMIGDLQQLTPVVTTSDEELLRPYYDTSYFFGSHSLQQIPYVTIELKKVYRQQNETFIGILNHIRNGELTDADLSLLNSRFDPAFRPLPKDGYIRLTTHNHMADTYNLSELNKLTTQPYHYTAEVKGTFPEFTYPTNDKLTFKVGAQVMFIKNDSSPHHQFYNGKIGQIIYLDKDHIEVLCQGDEHSILVERQAWENTAYKLNEQTKEIEQQVLGTFSQYPLRLAWAITIHKSQGLTFDHAIIDAGLSFASGQVYVALSRCRTLEGMVLASPINKNAVIYDSQVDAFICQQQAEAERSITQLPLIKKQYERFQLTELFNFSNILRSQEKLTRLFIDYFHTFPKLKMMHQSTMSALNEKVNIVAFKWTSYINQLTIEQIHDADFQKRIMTSATYFQKTLHQYLDDLMEQTKQVTSNNKMAMSRLKALATDLRESYLAKRYVLETIIEEGFTTQIYLKAKQEALLEALDTATNMTKRRKKETTVKKEKQENTKDTTLRLFKAGLSPEQIAQERNLLVGTIYTHLAYFIQKGDLSGTTVMEESKLKHILNVLEKIGLENGKTAIKTFCPANISYEEITLAIAVYQKRQADRL